MAVNMAVNNGGGGNTKLTLQVWLCSLIAACGGLMFGYDIGISGGVTSMDDFLLKFFRHTYVKKHRTHEDNYCKFNDLGLQFFTSSLYLAAMVASFFASKCCQKFGRKPTMQMASAFFLVGVVFNAAAVNKAMLIIGRLLLGAGVGFGNQAVPVFISEIAPPKHRGLLTNCFQLFITIGIVIANVINYFMAKIHPYGWRISLGGAAVPAILLGLGSLIIVETPTSLLERGKKEQALKALQTIRGAEGVQEEYEEFQQAVEKTKKLEETPWNNLLEKSNWPPLTCGILLQIFQQFTGINVIMFYAPVLFQTMGFEGDKSLYSTVITGGINTLSTLVAVFCVDRFGRRKLLLQAVIQMLITQLFIGGILATHLKTSNIIPKPWAIVVVIMICLFVMCFAWSWGPLGWLIPSEIFPNETRTSGFCVAVITNMFCTFLIGQFFLSMLCSMRSGIFFFFAAWVVLMGISAFVFLPETNGIKIDDMNERVWKKHWFWKRCFPSVTKQGASA